MFISYITPYVTKHLALVQVTAHELGHRQQVSLQVSGNPATLARYDTQHSLGSTSSPAELADEDSERHPACPASAPAECSNACLVRVMGEVASRWSNTSARRMLEVASSCCWLQTLHCVACPTEALRSGNVQCAGAANTIRAQVLNAGLLVQDSQPGRVLLAKALLTGCRGCGLMRSMQGCYPPSVACRAVLTAPAPWTATGAAPL